MISIVIKIMGLVLPFLLSLSSTSTYGFPKCGRSLTRTSSYNCYFVSGQAHVSSHNQIKETVLHSLFGVDDDDDDDFISFNAIHFMPFQWHKSRSNT